MNKTITPKVDFFIIDGKMIKDGDPQFQQLVEKYCKPIIITDNNKTEVKEENVNEQGTSKTNSK